MLVKQLKIKQKKKGGFLSVLLGTLAASLLGNVLAGKGWKLIYLGQGVIIADEGTTRVGHYF